MGMTVGIDLGTTNSAVAIKKLDVAIICNREGEEFTPSCVTAIINQETNAINFIVGRSSLNVLKQYPEQTIKSIKRFIGRDFADPEVQQIINDNSVSYKIITEVSEPGSIYIMLGTNKYTPEIISGVILKKLIEDSELELQGKIEQAVVTVPAYFSDRQKFATRAACDYAGIKLLRLLPEPTAAALSFAVENINNNDFRTIMVFDLGGGTFDISVLSLAGGSFMEITKGGDMWLGGDDIDNILIDHVFTCAQRTMPGKPIRELIDDLEPKERAHFLVAIKEKAEAAKILLSEQQTASIEMFGLLKDEKGQLLNIDVTITRSEFNQLIEPIVSKVSNMVKQILHEIRFEPELIDTVLMVGGSSFIVAIQDQLRKMFGADKVMVHPRPMLAIAEGAAIMAAKMAGEEQLFSMMHVAAHDYYLQLAGGKRHLLVARNTPLPVQVEEILKFTDSEQLIARLRVLNEIDGVMEPVGELWFNKNKLNPKKTDEVEKLKLIFAINEDNIITMKAWSLENKRLCVEAQIARGGLIAKLYNDLERALAVIISNSKRLIVQYDLLRLSSKVVTTILASSDPVTGATNNEQKHKAQQQINTLIKCQELDIAPLSLYEFALMAQKQGLAHGIFSNLEDMRLQDIIKELEQTLENLDDVNKFKKLKKELLNFYRDVAVALDLARAEDTAVHLELLDYKSEARELRQLAKKLANAYLQQDASLVQKARGMLVALVYPLVAQPEHPSRRFDRDVVL